MKYRRLYISSCPDSGVQRRNDNTGRDEICEGYYCQVYPVGDQYTTELDTFCLAEGYEIPDTSDSALQDGIIRYVNDNYHNLKEAIDTAEKKRLKDLVGKLACWLGESEEGAELYTTLSDVIGMTDDEIRSVGFTSLVPYFDREEYAQTIADWMISDGTEHTESGNWIVGYDEISERFAVNLKTDSEMRDMVSHALYDQSDIVADFQMDEDDVSVDFFYAYCPNTPENASDEIQPIM